MSKTRTEQNGQLILLLAAGECIADVSRKTGVSERTIYRRRHDPVFQKAVRHARDAMLDRGIGRLSNTLDAAIDALTTLLKDESAMVRLGAVKSLLETLLRYREHSDIVARLEELEGRLGQ